MKKFPKTFDDYLSTMLDKINSDKSIIINILPDCVVVSKVSTVTYVFDNEDCDVISKAYGRKKACRIPQHLVGKYNTEDILRIIAYVMFTNDCDPSAYPDYIFKHERIWNGTPRFCELRKNQYVQLSCTFPIVQYLYRSDVNRAYKFYIPSKEKYLYLDTNTYRNREVSAVSGFFGEPLRFAKAPDVKTNVPVCRSYEDIVKYLSEV